MRLSKAFICTMAKRGFWRRLGNKLAQRNWPKRDSLVYQPGLSSAVTLKSHYVMTIWNLCPDAALAEAERERLEGEKRKHKGRPRGGKEVDLKSGPVIRDIEAKHANSTAGRIAAKAGVSRYKAGQALKILEQSRATMSRRPRTR
jgi:hypothetical protein